jgi:hypothetical protein
MRVVKRKLVVVLVGGGQGCDGRHGLDACIGWGGLADAEGVAKDAVDAGEEAARTKSSAPRLLLNGVRGLISRIFIHLAKSCMTRLPSAAWFCASAEMGGGSEGKKGIYCNIWTGCIGWSCAIDTHFNLVPRIRTVDLTWQDCCSSASST